VNYRIPLLALVVALGMTVATTASAESPIDKEAALDMSFEALIDNAQSAFNDGDYRAAIEYQIVAERSESDPRLLLNIARSYEELDDCQSELAYYEAFLDNPSEDPALVDRAQSALDEKADDCEGYHDELGGRVFFESHPQLADVYIDDEPIGLTPTEAIGMSPGTYSVRLERDGYKPYTTELEISPDAERLDIRANLEEDDESDDDDAVADADESEPTAETDPVDEPPSVDDASFELNPIALGLIGGGVAAAATGAVFDVLLIPSIDDERSEASAAGDDSRVQELTEQRQNYATGAVAGYVVGAILGVAGGAWLGYDYYQHTSDGNDDNPLSWRLTPRFDHLGGGLWMEGRF